MMRERFSEVSLVDLPPMRVACFRAVSRTPEDDAAKVLSQWAVGAGMRDTLRTFGFDVDVSAEQAEAGLRGYELWCVVPEGVVASGPVTIRDFPGGRFAAMTIHDPFSDPFRHIPAGWEALHEWVITHGYEPPDATLCLEEVVAAYGGAAEGGAVDDRRDIVLYHPARGG